MPAPFCCLGLISRCFAWSSQRSNSLCWHFLALSKKFTICFVLTAVLQHIRDFCALHCISLLCAVTKRVNMCWLCRLNHELCLLKVHWEIQQWSGQFWVEWYRRSAEPWRVSCYLHRRIYTRLGYGLRYGSCIFIWFLVFALDNCTGRYCWEFVLAMAILSVRLSVCHDLIRIQRQVR